MNKESQSELAAALGGEGWQDVLLLDVGGLSYVFRATHPRLGRAVAIKVLKPELTTREIQAPGGKVLGTFASLFDTEVRTLAKLSHRCVMEILDAGALSFAGSQIPYFVMPFKKDAKNIYSYARESEWASPSETARWVLASLRDVLLALSHLHAHSFLHRDVKGDNIIVDAAGYSQLTDFGSVKELSRDNGDTLSIQDREYLHPDLEAYLRDQAVSFSDKNRVYLHLPRELLLDKGVYYDLYALGVTLERLRTILLQRLDPGALPFLEIVIRRLKSSGTTETPRYDAAAEVLTDLPKADPEDHLGTLVTELSAATRHTIRLPPVLSAPISHAIAQIIDVHAVRRLRRFRQLALVDEVYPGAVHTRFSHSLGVYHWTRAYLRALWHDQGDAYTREVSTPRDLCSVLVAALLHDVGQYPFAHAAEGVDGNLFSHDTLGQIILSPDHEDHSRLPERVKQSIAQLAGILRKEYRGLALTDVVAILKKTPPKPPARIDANLHDVFHSIIDGPIDADKTDYLVRDALHTGVALPLGPDPLFFASLTVDETRHAIALRPAGRDAAESLILLRYRLFKWVYWHRTVRATESILMEILDALLKKRGNDWAWAFKVKALESTEDELLAWLATEATASSLHENYAHALEGLRQRQLYSRVCTIAPRPGAELPEYAQEREIYNHMTRLKNLWSQGLKNDLDRATDDFSTKLGLKLGRTLNPLDVVLDIPIPQRHNVGEVRIIDAARGAKPISESSHIWSSIGEDFEHLARRVRVFIRPGLRAAIKRNAVVDALKDVFNAA